MALEDRSRTALVDSTGTPWSVYTIDVPDSTGNMGEVSVQLNRAFLQENGSPKIVKVSVSVEAVTPTQGLDRVVFVPSNRPCDDCGASPSHEVEETWDARFPSGVAVCNNDISKRAAVPEE